MARPGRTPEYVELSESTLRWLAGLAGVPIKVSKTGLGDIACCEPNPDIDGFTCYDEQGQMVWNGAGQSMPANKPRCNAPAAAPPPAPAPTPAPAPAPAPIQAVPPIPVGQPKGGPGAFVAPGGAPWMPPGPAAQPPPPTVQPAAAAPPPAAAPAPAPAQVVVNADAAQARASSFSSGAPGDQGTSEPSGPAFFPVWVMGPQGRPQGRPQALPPSQVIVVVGVDPTTVATLLAQAEEALDASDAIQARAKRCSATEDDRKRARDVRLCFEAYDRAAGALRPAVDELCRAKKEGRKANLSLGQVRALEDLARCVSNFVKAAQASAPAAPGESPGWLKAVVGTAIPAGAAAAVAFL